ncbi:hypothetical protein AMTRI_Chr06g190800 [Amborella trichopoda]
MKNCLEMYKLESTTCTSTVTASAKIGRINKITNAALAFPVTCEMDCLGNVAEMRDIVFQLDFLPRILLFHLVLALVIILEFGRPLYGDVFGVQQQERPNYEEELVDISKHWDDLEEEEEEEEEHIEEEELEVLEEKEERIAPGTLLRTTHMYVYTLTKYVLGAMDKTGAKRVELLLGQNELKALDDVTFAANKGRKEAMKSTKRGSARCGKKERKAKKKDFKF